MATKIEAMFGALKVYDTANSGIWSNYMRLRVTFQVTKPLRRGVLLEVDNRKQWYEVAYEKLPNFCYNCGMLGHLKKDYLEELVQKDEIQYGSWMRAMSLIKKHDKKNRSEATKVENIWSAEKLKVSGENSGEPKSSGSIEGMTHLVPKPAKKKLFDIINEISFSQMVESKDKETGEQGSRNDLLEIEQNNDKRKDPKEQEGIKESGLEEYNNEAFKEPLAQEFVGLELQSSQYEAEETNKENGPGDRDKKASCQTSQQKMGKKKEQRKQSRGIGGNR
ncbi:unnamed protein product [Linum trigynum]|uniref:Zinc knuckle CX2CX4HX4C domain-containing protein n=1 Tax=Linum trigynum TaxID=586398 RepID=A0AAV2GLK3_9ROSI